MALFACEYDGGVYDWYTVKDIVVARCKNKKVVTVGVDEKITPDLILSKDTK